MCLYLNKGFHHCNPPSKLKAYFTSCIKTVSLVQVEMGMHLSFGRGGS